MKGVFSIGKIHRLDENTVNKIAAGEIVERPASVVKELVENSIDAGASRIEIEIKNGGRQLIKVTDNGCGMEREDAVLAIERHATSKISSSEDLLNITSLGFRGEALPSIAAVSLFTITTKTAAKELGTCVEVKAGFLKKVKDTGAPDGTTIEVQDLFFNTPARLKYLKAIPTESGYINEIVTRLAMGYPKISFRLLHNDYEMLFTPGNGSYEDTIVSLFGRETFRELIPVNFESKGLKGTGFIGKPSIARNNRKYEIFYINGRFIYNKTLSVAIEKAYHTLLPIARYPFALIFLEIDNGTVDINVHPSKLEVRFADESGLFKILYHHVHNTLKDHSLLSEWITPDETFITKAESNQNPVLPPFKPSQSLGLGYHAFKETKAEIAAINEVKQDYQPELNLNQSSDSTPVMEPLDKESSIDSWFIFSKTVKNTYIIMQDDKGLLFIDQHAAHERILYEKFLRETNAVLGAQALLIPETITLSYAQYKIINERMSLFNDLGFDLQPFGGQSLLIREVPIVLHNLDYKQIILDLIEEYINFKTFKSPAEIKESFIITMACRAAVKAGDKLTFLETQGLVKDLFNCENPYTCPHGRPTVFRMSFEELAKKFLRR